MADHQKIVVAIAEGYLRRKGRRRPALAVFVFAQLSYPDLQSELLVLQLLAAVEIHDLCPWRLFGVA